MAITLVGTPQIASNTNGNDVTLTFSETPAENDYVVVFGGHGISGTGGLGPTTEGYTEITKYTGGSAPYTGAWYKKMTSSPDSSVTCNGGGNARDSVAYMCYVLRGVHLTTPQDATATTAGPTTGANPDPAAITCSAAGVWVLVGACSTVNDATVGTITDYTNFYQISANDSDDCSLGTATREVTAAGSENPGAWSAWSSGTWFAITTAWKPAPATNVVRCVITNVSA